MTLVESWSSWIFGNFGVEEPARKVTRHPLASYGSPPMGGSAGRDARLHWEGERALDQITLEARSPASAHHPPIRSDNGPFGGVRAPCALMRVAGDALRLSSGLCRALIVYRLGCAAVLRLDHRWLVLGPLLFLDASNLIV
jgi:hypothetical protein